MLLGLVGVEQTDVAARILLALDVDREQIRREVIGLLSGPAERRAGGDESPGRNGAQHPIDQAWFDGLGGHLNSLEREIRRLLGREPDSGDLLIALACARDTRAAHVLRELGVRPDSLAEAIARVRAESAEPPHDRSRQAHDDRILPPDDLEEIYRYLGLPMTCGISSLGATDLSDHGFHLGATAPHVSTPDA